ncbi:MAG: M48 family metalloprotease, partial [Proteobacteria bacterium]|nr:M48 family metalloprotease [Pseudomonadota bacterium]
YLSLYHLKFLEQSEANAIFAHEMAHFSGGDTYFSQKTSPLLHKVEMLLETLYSNAITRPIFYFMNLYVHLFQLSMSDLKRQREFRADKIASQVTSPNDMAKSLIKVIGFSDFRSQFERKLFGAKEEITHDKLFDSLRKSFAENISAETGKDIFNHSVTHPFDSHPSFVDRMKALNIQITVDEIPDILKSNVLANWYDEIANAESIESKLMEEYERRFKADHEINLAYTYLPANDHEKLIVERYFPELIFAGSGSHRLKINYEFIHYNGWKEPVLLSNIQAISHSDQWFMDKLFLEQFDSIPKKQRVQAIKINKFSKQKAEIISKISLYHQRCYYAKSIQTPVAPKE